MKWLEIPRPLGFRYVALVWWGRIILYVGSKMKIRLFPHSPGNIVKGDDRLESRPGVLKCPKPRLNSNILTSDVILQFASKILELEWAPVIESHPRRLTPWSVVLRQPTKLDCRADMSWAVTCGMLRPPGLPFSTAFDLNGAFDKVHRKTLVHHFPSKFD